MLETRACGSLASCVLPGLKPEPLTSEGTGPLWSCLLFLPSFAALPTGPPAALVFPAGSGFWLLSGPGLLDVPVLPLPGHPDKMDWSEALTWAWTPGGSWAAGILRCPGAPSSLDASCAGRVRLGAGKWRLNRMKGKQGPGGGRGLLRPVGVGSMGVRGGTAGQSSSAPSPERGFPWRKSVTSLSLKARFAAAPVWSC